MGPDFVIALGCVACILGGIFMLWFSRGYLRVEPRFVFDLLGLSCFAVAGLGVARLAGVTW